MQLNRAFLLAACALPAANTALAESAPERATIAYKYLDYLDSQPGRDRIRVGSSAVQLAVPVAGEWLLATTATTDAISGASPAYHSSALKKMTDQRNAIGVDVTRYFALTTLSVGANVSGESDYVSRGVSFKVSRSDESKNTTWNAAAALLRDAINPSNRVVQDETKNVTDALVGLTQVWSPVDIVQVNLGYSTGSGYFTDPYKAVDQRPRERSHWTLSGRWNHHFYDAGDTARLSYRYFSDTWGIRSHTLGLEWVRPLSDGWTMTPQARYYTQTAADFYVPADASVTPFAPNPPDGAVYFTEDHRLSNFGAFTLGLKVSKRLDADWSADVKVEWYQQRGEWSALGSGSEGLEPFSARSIQIGISRQF